MLNYDMTLGISLVQFAKGGGYIEPDDGLSATISDKSIESHDEASKY